ncbi:MAG: hypothetical protein DRN08_04050, partial [Thermoplasmata archaeon]
DKNQYIIIDFPEATSKFNVPGYPKLPYHNEIIRLPFTAKNIKVKCTPSDIKEISISKEILPASRYIVLSPQINDDTETVKNMDVYSSYNAFPDKWYSYSIGCGIYKGVRSVIVKISCNLARYYPMENKILYPENFKITVTYDKIETTENNAEQYDMVVIAPLKFLPILKPLIKHKNTYGVKTFFETTNSIYRGYSGRDKPEQIKRFIEYAVKNYNISYVLLVGGLKSYVNATDREDENQGSEDWLIPVRYTNIDFYENVSDPKPMEPGCPSDLYYADVYRYNETSGQTEFEDWDLNGNNITAEAKADLSGYSLLSDVMDLYPDVYVGRLACRNVFEAMIMVNKIIKYETKTYNESWFKTMVTIAGKTFGFYGGMPDGEYVCETSLGYMENLVEPKRLYVSNNETGGPRPIPKDIVKAFREGAGFVNFEGHGNPLRWDTIWADGSYPHDWAGGLMLYDFWKLFNLKKLPIVVIGGCHNGLFNVTIKKTTGPDNESYWTHGYPAPVCFAWGLCIVPWGGAIASVGGTGLGIGMPGNPVTLSAELETNFFYQLGQEGATTFGQAHSGAIQKYIDEHASLTATMYHCITIYQPFGDPSLRIGGYPS